MRLSHSMVGMTTFAILLAPGLASAKGLDVRNTVQAALRAGVHPAAVIQSEDRKEDRKDDKKHEAKQGIQVTLSGKVTALTGMSLSLRASNGSTYTVDLANAKIVRRSGATVSVRDIQVNDQLTVKGRLLGSTIQAKIVQDQSLLVRNGGFRGKVVSVASSSFVLQSVNRGSQVVFVSASTTIKLNNQTATMAAITPGATLRVDGVWNSANNTIIATKISLTAKEENMRSYGTVASTATSSLVLAGTDGRTYMVDTSKAKLVGRNYVGTDMTKIKTGDLIQIIGRGLAASLGIKATLIVDFSL